MSALAHLVVLGAIELVNLLLELLPIEIHCPGRPPSCRYRRPRRCRRLRRRPPTRCRRLHPSPIADRHLVPDRGRSRLPRLLLPLRTAPAGLPPKSARMRPMRLTPGAYRRGQTASVPGVPMEILRAAEYK